MIQTAPKQRRYSCPPTCISLFDGVMKGDEVAASTETTCATEACQCSSSCALTFSAFIPSSFAEGISIAAHGSRVRSLEEGPEAILRKEYPSSAEGGGAYWRSFRHQVVELPGCGISRAPDENSQVHRLPAQSRPDHRLHATIHVQFVTVHIYDIPAYDIYTGGIFESEASAVLTCLPCTEPGCSVRDEALQSWAANPCMQATHPPMQATHPPSSDHHR